MACKRIAILIPFILIFIIPLANANETLTRSSCKNCTRFPDICTNRLLNDRDHVNCEDVKCLALVMAKSSKRATKHTLSFFEKQAKNLGGVSKPELQTCITSYKSCSVHLQKVKMSLEKGDVSSAMDYVLSADDEIIRCGKQFRHPNAITELNMKASESCEVTWDLIKCAY